MRSGTENAYPWLVGMTYKAIRTARGNYIHWVNRGASGDLDEPYDLDRDPFELANVAAEPAYADVRETLRAELWGLVSSALGF